MRGPAREAAATAAGLFAFEVTHASAKSRARAGVMHTPHGSVPTPAFVPVGTNGVLKGVDHGRDDAATPRLMFANTLHIELVTGCKAVERAGGLHALVGRDAPIITDSGGFQVFSLSAQEGLGFAGAGDLKRKSFRYRETRSPLLLKCDDDGVTFRSYVDGAHHRLTPETAIEHQQALGSDIALPLDHLCGHFADEQTTKKSFELSHRWMERSLERHLADPKPGQALFGICHGGVDMKRREESAAFLTARPFDGFAIGGSLGTGLDACEAVVAASAPVLGRVGGAPRPVHLLGIADPESLSRFAAFGVDSFDSCYATRLARHGTLLCRGRRDGATRVKVKMTKCRDDHDPPDWDLAERLGDSRSLAFLHHIFRANEPLATTLLTRHNLAFMARLAEDLREAILRDEV